MEQEKTGILVSACLLGVNCRYDGKHGYQPLVEALKDRYRLIPVCPEQLGGMMTPREPSEIQAGARLCVMNSLGKDVTDFYVKGAEETRKLARIFGCKYAVLKERSPSCGHGVIYDGTFTGVKTEGSGVTASRLEADGIAVFGESRIEELLTELEQENIASH